MKNYYNFIESIQDENHQKTGLGFVMYLLVFVTLMIGVIGTYTQVLGLQAARFAAGQSGVGSAMLQWHSAAVSMAASIIKTNPTAYALVAAKGCSLSFTPPPGTAMSSCPSPLLMTGETAPGNPINTAAMGSGTITDGSLTPKLNLINYYVPTSASWAVQCVHLASVCGATNGDGCMATKCNTGYDVINHQFYSVLYKDTSGADYVVTFLPAPVITAANPAPGYLSTAGNAAQSAVLGLSANDLFQQLGKAGAPNYLTGSFQKFGTTPQLATTGLLYNLPTTGGLQNLCGDASCVANGSVAFIGSPDGF